MTSCKCHKLQEGYFSIQGRLCVDSNSEKSDPMFPSERPNLIVRTRWQNHPDAHQRLVTSNYSRLHLSGRNCKSSGRYLEFKKILEFQCICPDDVLYVLYRPDAQLSKHHPFGQRELSVWTFLCVEKLQTVQACIRPDVSAAHPDTVQCSISYGISFQNTYMGRQLQPFR
jgi:hypothetical protein